VIRCLLALALAIAAGAARAEPVNDALIREGEAPALISAFNLFKDWKAQVPNDGLVPYDLNTPLFSDYAAKYRFVYVPAGQSALYHATSVFDFPVGSVFIKTFAFPADRRNPNENVRVIETRLLIKRVGGWIALPYVWDEALGDAHLKIAGAKVDVSWIHDDGSVRSIRYAVPNKNQCKGCHDLGKEISLIGPKAGNLNRDYAYAEGAENQLAHWMKLGILSGSPEPSQAPRAAVFDNASSGSLDARARAYLDINCGHCHNAQGPANTSGLFLDLAETNPTALGIMKRPVAAGRGSGNREFAIDPGRPENSILLYRMESTDPGVMMPELSRSLVHDEGIALIREWIAKMPGSAGIPARP
jgi:uncharacterized repeat protein (TIGR03806 family)